MLLRDIKELNTKTINAFEKKNIFTTEDIVRMVPRKYLDYRTITPLDDAVGKDCCIAGYVEKTIKDTANNVTMLCLELIEETTGKKVHVKWFGKAFIWERVHSFNCKEIVVCGKVTFHETYGYTMMNPHDEFGLLCEKEKFHGKIVPVYRKIKGISEEMHKRVLKYALDNAEEPLEPKVLEKVMPEFGVKPYRAAALNAHFPRTMEDIESAGKRFYVNDCLYFALKTNADLNIKESTYRITKYDITEQYRKSLPYELTKDQMETYLDIRNDLASGKRVKALVQGDVGCGKTIIAILSMFLMAENGYQSVLMAPTQVLAEQHYNDLVKSVKPYGFKVALLTGKKSAKEKRELLSGIVSGEYQFIVGTQATYSKQVMYHKLGLVIGDEEHRFGVAQKNKLSEKTSANSMPEDIPHDILMSATPIPRTTAEIVFGGTRKIYNIHTMPNGRQPIKTAINASDRGNDKWIEMQLKEGRQCYVICPLVGKKETDEDDEEDGAAIYSVMDQLESVEETAKRYKSVFEPMGYKVGMAVGSNRGKDNATQETLDSFARNEIQILVATTVVEVGVNVPNANVIVINNAERFGLAQLHQLRGRVGRGKYQSYCILKSKYTDNERLNIMCNTLNGFEIAEEDLRLRGTGDLFGEEQTGFNKYIDMATANPETYKKIAFYAKAMRIRGYGADLIALYEEQAMSEDDEKEQTKAS